MKIIKSCPVTPTRESSKAKHLVDSRRAARSARRRRIAVLVALGSAGWLIYTAVRSRHLLAQAHVIAQQSSTFQRDYYVGNPAHPALTYLVMGDSTAVGWGATRRTETYSYQVAAHAASHGYRVHVVVAAVGGARLRDVTKRQIPYLRSVRPQLVTLSVGANDATHFTSQEEFARDLTALLSQLQQSTARRILIANTPDMYQAPAVPWPLGAAINIRARQQNQLLEAALRGSRIRLIDLYAKGKLIYKNNPNVYAADLFHPSATGYDLWARLFQERLFLQKGKL